MSNSNPVYQKPLSRSRLSASEVGSWLDNHPIVIAEADTDDTRHKKRLVRENGMYKVLLVSYKELGRAQALANGFGGQPVVTWHTFSSYAGLADAVRSYNITS
jgi:hypothetical protein